MVVPFSCQPPAIAFNTPLLFNNGLPFPKGSPYVQVPVNRKGVFTAASAHSAPRSYAFCGWLGGVLPAKVLNWLLRPLPNSLSMFFDQVSVERKVSPCASRFCALTIRES